MLRFATALLLACLVCLVADRASAAPGHYELGVAAFEKKDWPAAREAFEAVIEKDQSISNDLCFNLGNTLFREDKPGLAALWYRRALLLDPRDGAARQNLRLLKRRTGFLESEPTLGRIISSLRKHSQWRWGVAGAAWTATLSLGALLFLRLRGFPRAAAWTLLLLAVPATGIAAWGAWARLDPMDVSRRSVVIAAESSALAAPTDTAEIIIDLPPGSEVLVREVRDAWSFIEVPADERSQGWVRTSALTRLWPYSPALIQ